MQLLVVLTAALVLICVHAIPVLTGLPDGFSATRIIATALESPIRMVFSPASDLYVCEQAGRLLAFTASSGYATMINTLTLVNFDGTGERGLLGVAFHPELTDIIYITYTNIGVDGVSRNVIASFVFDPMTLKASLDTEQRIFTHDQLSAAINHNAGPIFFSGKDSEGFPTLFASHGDNAVPFASQLLTTTHGKVLRLRADGSPASDNPFINRVDSAHESIFAIGLRNPFAMFQTPEPSSLTFAGPKIILPDVGDWHSEEINALQSGFNGGWPMCEGTLCTPSPPNFMEGTYSGPFFEYGHFAGSAGAVTAESPAQAMIGIALASATVYAPRPTPLDVGAFPPAFQDTLFVADYGNGGGVDLPGGWIYALSMSIGSLYNNSGGKMTGPGTLFATGLNENTVGLEVGPPATGPSLFILSRGPSQVNDGSIIAVTYSPRGPPILSLQPLANLIINLNSRNTISLSVGASGAAPLSFQWQTHRGTAWIDIDGAIGPIWTPNRALFAFATLGDSVRCSVSNALGIANSLATVITMTTALPPTVLITFPYPPYIAYTASDVLRFQIAVSSVDTTITWTALFNHAFHAHPLASQSGKNDLNFQFTVPTIGEVSTNVSISVYATVFDAITGLSTISETITLHPLLGAIIFNTQPIGLAAVAALLLDGSTLPSDGLVIGVAGMIREISASANIKDKTSNIVWSFHRWSDDVTNLTRTFIVPSSSLQQPVKITAIYLSLPDSNTININTSSNDTTSDSDNYKYVYIGLGALGLVVLLALIFIARAKWFRSNAPPPTPFSPPRNNTAGAAFRQDARPSLRLRSPHNSRVI